MEYTNRRDMLNVFAALLRDVQTARSEVFSLRSLRLTTRKVESRIDREGVSFLTKSLPRLGKALDRALSGDVRLDCTGFRKKHGSQLPIFMGELFELIFTHDGMVLPSPCVASIHQLRDILYLFYKYGLPYNDEQEQKVLQAFKKAEEDICSTHEVLQLLVQTANRDSSRGDQSHNCSTTQDPLMSHEMTATFLGLGISKLQLTTIRKARFLLKRLFEHFDPTDIVPRHGPGSVSTKEKLSGKYRFTVVSDRITELYPYDAYFCASMGHVCDTYHTFKDVVHGEPPARVILVPKDSRGPRLISAEPLAMQWIQQGLGSAIVRHVERHTLTKYNVHFTDQGPNQRGSLLGSSTGRYATLDLKEASDRVTLGLVRALFPSGLLPYLEAARSLSTEMPDGSIIKLNKFAPMGSALCFPILALTVWAILTASASDTDARESILVYGDDVIVKTAEAAHAIEQLESFGLKVNHDKSCVKGSFRESCGVDAFKGINITPLRLKKLWPSTRSPESYASWIAYANQFYDRKYYHLYWHIASRLYELYGAIPEDSDPQQPEKGYRGQLSLREVPTNWRAPRRRLNAALQRTELKIWCLEPRKTSQPIDGWLMLLRYFTEGNKAIPNRPTLADTSVMSEDYTDPEVWPELVEPFSVSTYTKRKDVKLSLRWR